VGIDRGIGVAQAGAMRFPNRLLGVLVLAGLSSPALAAQTNNSDEPPPPAPTPAMVPHWYGGRIIAADVTSILVTFVLPEAVLPSRPYVYPDDINDHGSVKNTMTTVGLISLVGTPALIHLAHGNSPAALKSLGLRVGLPAAGLLVSVAILKGGRDCDETCALGGAGMTLLVMGAGMLGAGLYDVLVLARDEHPAAVTTANARKGFTLAGAVPVPRSGGGTLNLVGTF
jgi:hypothetical protein